MNEREFSRVVVRMAEEAGYRVMGIHNTRRGGLLSKTGVGWPDLTLLRGRRLLFVELKTDKGKYGPGQREWLAMLRKVSDGAYTWRPRDLRSGRIARILAGQGDVG